MQTVARNEKSCSKYETLPKRLPSNLWQALTASRVNSRFIYRDMNLKSTTTNGFNFQIINSLMESVSIKHGLRTADYGLRTEYKIRTRYKTRTGKYGLGIKHGLGIKRGLRTADCGLGIKYRLRTTLVKTVLIGSR